MSNWRLPVEEKQIFPGLPHHGRLARMRPRGQPVDQPRLAIALDRSWLWFRGAGVRDEIHKFCTVWFERRWVVSQVS